jgi:methylated-DNA-[protein]-cysteine S-methyltransferase
MMKYTYLNTLVGNLMIAGDSEGLRFIHFIKGKDKVNTPSDWVRDDQDKLLKEAVQQLKDYFNGQRQEFDLKLAPEGTEFQLKVLEALKKIPYGQTCSYGTIAKRIGSPKAVRAVGGANGRNPLPIVIPCHRVIGQSGALVGFTSGLSIKKQLLALEKTIYQRSN